MKPIENDYKWLKDFREYVDKFAKQHDITPEEALEYEVVRQAWRYYTEL